MRQILLILLFCSIIHGGELQYQAQNPAFGGNFYNAQWLMSTAQAQSTYKEKREESYSAAYDPLQSFEESLNRQVLSRLSREIMEAAFGNPENADFTEGSYQIGDYSIDIDPSSLEYIVITIVDELTGNSTVVEVPYYDTNLPE